MKTLLLTQFWPGYEEVADITGARRDAYVEHWRSQGRDYSHRTQVGDYHPGNTVLLPKGFQRIRLMLDILSGPDAPEAIWWQGADTLILNRTIPVDDLISGRHYEQYDLFVAADVHGINADSMILRNTPWMRGYLGVILNLCPRYTHHCWQEQKAIMDTWQTEGVVHKVCLLPQSLLNSYLYRLYKPWDPADCNGNVRKGDLLLHLVGLDKAQRLGLLRSQEVADLMVDPVPAGPAATQ